jgi:DNA-directed RNA polymerase specialized sigma24 family protein
MLAQEVEWIQRASQGDQEAFDKLFEIYIDRIYTYFLHRVRSNSVAEILTSKALTEATLLLAQGHSTLRDKPFKLMLYSIARNVLLEGNYQSPNLPFQEVQDGLWRLIPELPFAVQDILIMCHLDHLSFAETAILLSCSEQDSKRSYEQALSKLKALAREKGVLG